MTLANNGYFIPPTKNLDQQQQIQELQQTVVELAKDVQTLSHGINQNGPSLTKLLDDLANRIQNGVGQMKNDLDEQRKDIEGLQNLGKDNRTYVIRIVEAIKRLGAAAEIDTISILQDVKLVSQGGEKASSPSGNISNFMPEGTYEVLAANQYGVALVRRYQEYFRVFLRANNVLAYMPIQNDGADGADGWDVVEMMIAANGMTKIDPPQKVTTEELKQKLTATLTY